MLRLEQLEQNPDVEKFLIPKKKLTELVKTVDKSMLKMHQTIKTSKDLEALAAEFFKTKTEFKEFKARSGTINIDNLRNKLTNLKNIKIQDVDFV
jgi:hypothetical protein